MQPCTALASKIKLYFQFQFLFSHLGVSLKIYRSSGCKEGGCSFRCWFTVRPVLNEGESSEQKLLFQSFLGYYRHIYPSEHRNPEFHQPEGPAAALETVFRNTELTLKELL